MEDTLSQDITTLSGLSPDLEAKAQQYENGDGAVFYLNSREAKRELNVYNNGNLLPPCPVPTHLGVKLDRSLTSRYHLEALRKNSPPELRC